MIKNWDFKKHTISCIVISILISIVMYSIINPQGEGNSVGIIGSVDGSGPSAIYVTNHSYKSVLTGSVVFMLTMASYKLIRKEV